MKTKSFCAFFCSCLIGLSISFCFNIFLPKTNIFAQAPVFARVENLGTYFYSTPIASPTYVLFELPTTYFVELTGNADDKENLFFSARYMDCNGYVKKTAVEPVAGIPITPFASNQSFRVFSPTGLDLKSSPAHQTPFNKVASVPYLCSNLIFYGKCIGEAMVPEKSNIWYYCQYLSGETTYHGYLYSEFCDKLTYAAPNTETLPAFNGELFATITPSSATTESNNMPSELKIFIILAISIPCLFIIYLLFKPTKLVSGNNQKQNQKKISKLRRSEFYELED